MIIKKIDAENNEATLSLNKHEITIIRRALQRISDELTSDDEWFLLEIIGVNDLLKDGNFARFLSYHREIVKEETKGEIKAERNKL